MVAAALAAELPAVTMRVPEATYLAWLDCRALELPCLAGQFFLDQARVGLNFGETFGADYAGFARLNFATPPAGNPGWPRNTGRRPTPGC